MKYIFFIALLILASATLGSAQIDNNINDISEICKAKLLEMVRNKDLNSCFPFGTVASLKPNSDEATLKTTADNICSLPKCSDDLVKKTRDDVKAACQADANKDSIKLINALLILYSPTRDSICFKNSTDGYCFLESRLASEQILQSAPKDQDPAITFGSAPKEVVCTPCNKGIFNSYFNYQKEHPEAFAEIEQITTNDIDNVKNILSAKCGSKFLDGKVGDTKQSPTEFLQQQQSKSDAMSLIANRMNLVAIVGSILATL